MVRRILYWLLAAAAVWFIATHLADIGRLWAVMRGGDWRLLLVAAALQIVYYAFYIGVYQASFAAVGVERAYREFVPVVLGTFFVNAVTPTAGTAGTALVVGDSVKRGYSAASSTAGWVLTQALDFAAFGVIMIAGFIYLTISAQLKTYEVVAAAVLVAIIASFVAMFVLALVRPGVVVRVLAVARGIVAAAARLVRREPPLSEEWPTRTAEELAASSRLLADHPRGVAKAGGLAVTGYVFDVFSMIAVGYAFGWHHPGALLAAYAVGVLVWLTSIVPQGIGVVEGAIALVLTSFGASVSQGAAVSLVFRGISFWLPMLLGFVLLRRVSTFKPERRSLAAEAFSVRVAAVVAAAVGTINILSAVTPSIRARVLTLEHFMPLEVRAGHLAAALAGLGLIYLSRGLWRRKRAAWVLAIALLALSIVSHLLKGLDYEEALVAGAALLWLATQRDAFHARSDTPSMVQGIRVLIFAVLGTMAYGTIGFYLLDRHFSVNFNLWTALRQTIVMFTQFYDPGLEPISRFGRFFAYSIYVIAAVSFAYALSMLLRSVLVREPSTPAERTRAKAIIEEWGRSSLAAVNLLPDKSYFFTEGGSVVAYSYQAGHALALGDPIGPPEDFDAAVDGFKALASRNGWVPVFYQTLPDDVPRYEAAGFRALRIGHEAIVKVAEFSLAGGSKKSLRNRVHRLEEDGYTTVVHDPPISRQLMRELRTVSDGWLSMVHGTEKRYSLGWFLPEYIAAGPVMAVHAPDGSVVAFANILSEYRLPESTIDLMRHLPEAPSGVMDFMFVRLFEWCRQQAGCETFNLGLSSLADIGQEPDDPLAEKALRLVYEHLGQFYNFKGLHAYKEKFDPIWEPRFLLYPPLADLPRIFYALTSADAGESVVANYLKTALVGLRKRRERPAERPAGEASA